MLHVVTEKTVLQRKPVNKRLSQFKARVLPTCELHLALGPIYSLKSDPAAFMRHS